jgi:hypothetical protein
MARPASSAQLVWWGWQDGSATFIRVLNSVTRAATLISAALQV